MQAAIIKRYGGPDVFELRDVPKPSRKANECLVRVHAASINDWDWGLMQGTPFVNRMMGGLFTPKLSILGCDVAGRVEAVGESVRDFAPGDAVFGDLSSSGFGAFAEYVCAPEGALVRMPASMTFEQAASLPQAGQLAVQGLGAKAIEPGMKVLLNGGGGGVGTFALQIAKLHGAEVTAVDSAAKLPMLRALGADYVIDYKAEDFTKGRRRYDLILDTKTNRSPWEYARVLHSGGTYSTVGGDLSRALEWLLWGPVIARVSRKHVRLVVLRPNRDLAGLSALVDSGTLKPVIDGPYKLADIAEAFRRFGAADHQGKIILTMG